jgi:putative flippase GtrA
VTSTLGVRARETGGQLVRFCLVGGSGYVVNLAVFALCAAITGGHRVAAVAAFLVAVTNNFVWNRRWTFDAREGHAGHQAARFLTVSVLAFLLSFVLLELLAADGAGPGTLPELAAQAIAIVAVTPVSFAGNRLWTFRA